MSKRINITLSEQTLSELDNDAKSLGLTRSAYISFLVNSVHRATVESSLTPEYVAASIPEYQK